MTQSYAWVFFYFVNLDVAHMGVATYMSGLLAFDSVTSFLYFEGERKRRIKMIGIYKIENLVNGKVYIGQSINIEQRWYNHIHELDENRHCNSYLQNSWNKYGKEKFKFSIIEECLINEIDEKEIYWIKYYDSLNPTKGYNLTAGGQGLHGYTWSEDQKERQSLLLNPEPILQFDLKGNLLERWRSASYAARMLNIPASSIMGCLREEESYYQTHGFLFFYEKKYYSDNIDIQEYIDKYINVKKNMLEYDLYGKLLRVWKPTEFYKEYKNSTLYKQLSRVLNHEIKTAQGRIFLYEDDDFELTDDYLRKCRIDSYRYLINQFDKFRNIIKTWTQEELDKSEYKHATVIKCCRENFYKYKENSTAYGYIWEYE